MSNILSKARKPEKYGINSEVPDPVERCDSCCKLVLATDIHKYGKCLNCGNRKVRTVMTLNLREYLYLRYIKRVDSAFISRFDSPWQVFERLLFGGINA